MSNYLIKYFFTFSVKKYYLIFFFSSITYVKIIHLLKCLIKVAVSIKFLII